MTFLTNLVLFSVVSCCCMIVGVRAAEEGHVHKCACEAEEFGFTIDCDNTAAVSTAMAALQAGGCSADCSTADCEKNFLIVQSHHDYCPEDALPAGRTVLCGLNRANEGKAIPLTLWVWVGGGRRLS